MKTTLLLAASALAALTFQLDAHADVISDWNQTSADYLDQNAGDGYIRGMTMVHVAQFDAANAVALPAGGRICKAT